MGTVDGPPLPLHTAGSFPTLLVERWRSVCAVNPSKTEPSPWLSIDDDLFRRWRARLESNQETVGELEALLRSPETRSAYVTSGELSLLDGEFWRDTARLEVVPDADGVGDRLEVCRPTYVHGDGPFSFLPGGTFLVRRLDVERWEAALPPAPSKEPTPLVKKGAAKAKPRKPKQPRVHKRNTTDDALMAEAIEEPTPPAKYKRYKTDDALVAEAIEGLKSNQPKYPNKWQAALALAPRAEGSDQASPGGHPAKVYRLNTKIGNALKIPQNISKQIK